MHTNASPRRSALLVIAAAALTVTSCTPSNESAASDNATLRVMVSIPPLATLARRIGGERVTVDTLVTPGQEPHTFSLTPRQAMALGDAHVYFHVSGFPFEFELSQRIEANFPALAVRDVSAEIMRLAGGCTHGHHHHGHDHHHAHCAHETDPHVWMAPPMLASMAAAMAETLTRLDPSHAAAYAANLDSTVDELDALDGALRDMLAPHEDKAFYIYHPALGYFAETYGLHQKAVEFEGKKPTPRQLQNLVAEARRDGARVIFVQPQFDVRSAQAIAEAIGGAVMMLDPLREDIFENLREIGVLFADTLAPEDEA